MLQLCENLQFEDEPDYDEFEELISQIAEAIDDYDEDFSEIDLLAS